MVSFNTNTGAGFGPPLTAGGVPLTPVPLDAPEVSTEQARADAEAMFPQSVQTTIRDLINQGYTVPEQDIPIIDIRGPSLLDGLQQAYETQREQESIRVENVLKDVVSDYAGANELGVLSFKQKDNLARMPRFEQRQAYFKNIFPEGELFRVPTDTAGGLVELYRTNPQSKAFRVSDDVFSFSDVGAFTGTFLTGTTAGSVIGSFFTPFFGTAAGAYLGATFDEYIANSLAEDKFIGFSDNEDFVTKLFSGNRVATAFVDGFLTKALPIMGRTGKYLSSRATELGPKKGEASLLYELGFFSVSPKAFEAQKAAREIAKASGVDLPLLNISQLSDSVLLRGIASQATGTANTLTKNLSKQESRLLQALNKKVVENRGDLSAFDDKQLKNYINLQQKALADDVFLNFRASNQGYGIGSTTVSETGERVGVNQAQSIVTNAKNLDNGFKTAIDRKYQEAFSLAGIDNVTFDLSPLLKVADEIQEGLPLTAKPKLGRDALNRPKTESNKKVVIGKETAVRSQPLGGELGNIVNDLKNVLDPTLKTVKAGTLIKGTKGVEVSKNVDAFQQLKNLRDRVGTLLGESSDASTISSAGKLRDAIDDLIVNGYEKGLVTGGSDAWRKSYLEAGQLVKARSQAQTFANLGKLISTRAEVLPQTVVKELLDGGMNAEQFNILRNLVRTTALNEADKQAGAQFIQEVKEFAIADLLRTTDASMVSKIERLKNVDDSRLFNMIFPQGSLERQSIDELYTASKKLAQDPVQAALEGTRSRQQRLMAYVRNIKSNQQDLAVQRFINANGGINGEAAQNLRAGLLMEILEKSRKVQDIPGQEFATDVVDAELLKKNLSQLKADILGGTPDITPGKAAKTAGQYSSLKALFGKVDDDGNITFQGQGKELFNLLTNAELYTAFLANTADVGGPFATGAIRSAVTSGTFRGTVGAAKDLFTNKIITKIFAANPSVEQLNRALRTNARQQMRRTRIAVTLLNQFLDGLDIDVETRPVIGPVGAPVDFLLDVPSNVGQETPQEETQRTGQKPQLGTQTQQVSGLNIPPLPLASTPTSTRTSFDNLFPRDDIGSAIANRNRSGIMALT